MAKWLFLKFHRAEGLTLCWIKASHFKITKECSSSSSVFLCALQFSSLHVFSELDGCVLTWLKCKGGATRPQPLHEELWYYFSGRVWGVLKSGRNTGLLSMSSFFRRQTIPPLQGMYSTLNMHCCKTQKAIIRSVCGGLPALWGSIPLTDEVTTEAALVRGKRLNYGMSTVGIFLPKKKAE